MYAEVIVDLNVRKISDTFTYEIPLELEEKIEIGSPVIVPFGSKREILAYVTNIQKNTDIPLSKIKSIISLSDSNLDVDTKLIMLAMWMKDRYGGSLASSLKAVMPVKDKVREVKKKIIVLNVPRDELDEYIYKCDKKHHSAKLRIAKLFLEVNSININELNPKPTNSTISSMIKDGIIIENDILVARSSIKDLDTDILNLSLNDEQTKAYNNILKYNKLNNGKAVSLVKGITGSGKTELYISLIKNEINKHKQVIMLIPEISLTYQTVKRFKSYFGDRIAIMNSSLSKGERYDSLMRAKNGDIDIIIGPRSALFTPFKRLGLVIIDEEHDTAYKSDITPKYKSVEVAIKRASIEGANVVLGSATPSIESYYKAKNGEYNLVRLDKRYKSASLPNIEFVDMCNENMNGNQSLISRELLDKMSDRLDKKEQIILFINRRGVSQYVMCKECGYTPRCPHCDVSLCLHRDGKLKCHYCGYNISQMSICPKCNSKKIGKFKDGIQQVEELLEIVFPKAKILRMDSDSTRQKGSFFEMLSSFERGEYDILLGTQMIVKGHDFPNVTLVGILAADQGLNIPDYKSSERNFQLITQGAGRAGRADKIGEVIIQSYNKESPSIVYSLEGDYDSFYETEIRYRNLMNYPPIVHLLVIRASYMDKDYLDKSLSFMKIMLEKMSDKYNINFLGPVEPMISKIKDRYIVCFYVRHEKSEALIWLRKKIEKYIELNKGYKNISFEYELE